MLQPKRTKFRRSQKGRMKGNAQRGNQLAFGSFGIKALEEKWIEGRQIEAARVAVTRYMQRQGQIWIRIFPDKPITKKPAEVRMGKGKGNPEGFVAPVTPGRIMLPPPIHVNLPMVTGAVYVFTAAVPSGSSQKRSAPSKA